MLFHVAETRFFETGDNYYLGMEFTREYDKWKNELGEDLVATLRLKMKEKEKKIEVDKLKSILMHHVDRLWYEACLEGEYCSWIVPISNSKLT